MNNFDDNLLLMQEMANIGYWVFYIEKKIVWASDQAFKIYGVYEIDNNFKPEEAIQFSTPLSKRKITNAIDNLIKFNIEYNVDIEINRANDNQLRILNTSGKLIKDEEGNPYKIFGIIQDVTEDRMKSEELKSAKEDLEIALNDSPIPTILHAEDGEILLINKACLDATGFHESQIPDVSTWTKLVHRDRKEFNDEFIKSNFEEGVSSQGGEEYVYTKSGERRIWAFHNSNLGILKDGRKTIITVGVDVTDKKTLIDSLEKSSAYDSLTGVLNRKSYEEALVKLDDKEYYPLVLLFGDINGLKLINDTFGHQAGDKLLSKTAKIIQSKLVDEENIYRIGGDEFAIIMPKSNLVRARQVIDEVKLETSSSSNDEFIGEISISFGYAIKNELETKMYDIIKSAEDFMYRSKTLESPTYKKSAIEAMMNTLYEKDKLSEMHSHTVSEICKKFGIHLSFSKSQIEELETAGLLHDIGKIIIPTHIIQKKSSLTKEEYFEMKKHSEIGFRILKSLEYMSEIATIVLHHHERFDGKGYPKGLSGDMIPIQSRIIAIVDAFVLMTVNKSYGIIMTKEEAIDEILFHSGTQFDPILVDHFVRVMKEAD